MLYGIIGEDRSDVDTLKVLVKRLVAAYSLAAPHFHLKGYEGWSEMFQKGVAQLRLLRDLKCHKIIVCFDADGPEEKASERREKIRNEIVAPSGVTVPCCALVPVQELEAWVLADIQAVCNIITSLRTSKSFSNPERVPSPKEALMKISRCPRTRKEKYEPPRHNPLVAKYLNLKTIEGKCPSFSGFVDFITGKSQQERSVKKRRRRKN
jgi:hypothetical protein